jgi:hypothetical protein
MRIIVGVFLGVVVLAAGSAVSLGAAGAAAPAAPAAPAPAAPAAVPAPAAPAGVAEEAGVRSEDLRFDIYTDNQKVGHLFLKIMAVADAAILDEEFAAPFKAQEAFFESKIVYRGTGRPVPQSAKVNTRFGAVNVMSGAITFTAAGGTLTAKEEATGFADRDRKLLTKPLVSTKETVVPKGLVLTYAAFLYFAPRLLPEPGQLENVVYTEFPADINFPSLIKFNPDVVLARAAETADGRSEFMVKRLYPGGNFIPITVMTIDKEGRIVETRVGQFTLVPEGAKPRPTKEPPREPAKGPAKMPMPK